MRCIHISSDLQQIASDHPDGLCVVCQKIDFEFLTRWSVGCEDHKCHLHIGHLKYISRKRSCPGCRLILSAIEFANIREDVSDSLILDVSDEATVTLSQQSLVAYPRHPYQVLDATETDSKDLRVALPMSNLIDVIVGSKRLFGKEKVAGTIIHREGTGVVNTVGPVAISHDSSGGSSKDYIVSTFLLKRLEEDPSVDLMLLESWKTKLTTLDRRSSEQFSVRPRAVLPKVDIDLIKNWIHFCDVHHQKCRLVHWTVPTEQRIRLIDVCENRIIPTTMSEEYVALSYVWGPTTAPILTQETVLKYSSPNGLKNADIPQTISDSIQFVRDLGKRYLWVDTLCIVQDDDNDKGRHLPIMDSVYSRASLVIVAAAGVDAYAGLPGIGSARNPLQTIEEINGIQFTTVQPTLQQILGETTWNTRGWTFQEMIISRRVLVFTERQVYWNCLIDIWREDLESESTVAGLGGAESLRCYLFTPGKCRTLSYCRLAEEFSRRFFGKKDDALWAFQGIFNIQVPRFPKGFIWGLPYERLDATLLWQETGRCRMLHKRVAQHNISRNKEIYNLPYPSWSWLSCATSITFWNKCGDSIISEVTWHEPFKLGDILSTDFPKSVYSVGTRSEGGYQQLADLLSGVGSNHLDYGLLRFTARTAVLDLEWKGEQETEAEDKKAARSQGGQNTWKDEDEKGDNAELIKSENDGRPAKYAKSKESVWVTATILLPSGESIGTLLIPIRLSQKGESGPGEFVLLSSNADPNFDGACHLTATGPDVGTGNHVPGCQHVESHNIMLIEWEGGIAYRQALGKVKAAAWRKVETQEKKIILG